jgi:DNA-binding GntR family transcriptional regulator
MSTTRPATEVPVQNRTLREQVVDYLREEILANHLTPGTELGEVSLAQSLGVSRGPLREALGQLAAEGLVTIVPRRGAVVKTLTQQEFLDAYEVREALESLAIKLAVPRLRDSDRAKLRRMCRDMEQAAETGDTERFFEINHDFHAFLVRASRNKTLEQMHTQLIAQMGRLLKKSVELRGGVLKSAAEHRAIVAAVDAGDAGLAARLLEEHIEVPQRVLRSSAADALLEEQTASQPEEEPPAHG